MNMMPTYQQGYYENPEYKRKAEPYPKGRPRSVELDVDAAALDYESGLTLSEVAERHGCSESTIRTRLLEHGVTMRKGHRQKGVHIVETESIVHDYQAGMPMKVIGERHGLSYQGVQYRLRVAGVERRKTGRPRRVT